MPAKAGSLVEQLIDSVEQTIGDWKAYDGGKFAVGASVGDRLEVDEICDKWLGFWNIPMASNLQMIFYKNKAGDVLVKFLYQEQERLLRGLEPFEGPYYKWETVKANLEGYKRF